jgi:glycerol-3-phosphate dehydrogenase
MAQGDLALVHEAATERKAVEQIAPHLTRLTPFVIPAKDLGGIAKLRAGLWAFEKLGSVPKARHHEVWSKRQLEENEPAVATRDTAGAVAYPEYLTNDARLTLANVRSAAAHGAQVITYAPVESLILEGGRAVGAVIGDSLSGAKARARVRATVIINAAGPWVDAVRRLEMPGAETRLQLTKGIHVVVPKARLPVTRTIIMPAADRRSVFAVPAGQATYLGTTDTFYPATDDWPAVERADVDYLLAAAARRFSTPTLTTGDITAIWSGVRPLVAQAGKSASEISRRDEIWTGAAGVLAIAGGKLTAYRKMAERIVDMVEEALGRTPKPPPTDVEPLVGGDVDVPAAITRHGERLARLYGSEADAIADAGGDIAAEARHAVLNEGALTLEDYWIRRSARAWFDLDGGRAALQPAARAMAMLLGQGSVWVDAQVAACLAVQQSLRPVQPVEASCPT